jgi:CAI-1 autoinducer synthase
MRRPSWFAEQIERGAAVLGHLDPFPFDKHLSGSDGLRLDQNDYLRLSDHPAVIAARDRANRPDRPPPVAASVFAISAEEEHLASMLCRVLRAPRTLITTAGWTANVGLMAAIATPLRPVYMDRGAHASLYDGIRLAGAHRVGVRHNDPEALERKIQHGGPGIVCIDAVYSNDGSVADLPAYVEVCERYACVLVVDEAHSFAMFGTDGGGLAVECGVADRVHFRTGSLSKALGGYGGFIAAADGRMFDLVSTQLRPVIFSSATSPVLHAGHAAALRVVCDEPERAARCLENGRRLAGALRVAGLDVGQADSQIVSISFRDYGACRVFGALRDVGILTSVFVEPAAPQGATFLRFSIHSELSAAEIDSVASATIAAVEAAAPDSVVRNAGSARAA